MPMFRFTLTISPAEPISETEPDADGVSHMSFMVIEKQVFPSAPNSRPLRRHCTRPSRM